jgi:MFS family permease
VLSSVFGALLAGVLVALAAPESALAATGALFAVAGIAIVGVQEPGLRQQGGRVLADAWSGVLYVVRNRTLVGLALTFFAMGIGWGSLIIAVPVLVLDHLHEGPATVGYVWGAVGAAGFVSSLIVGRLRTRGRERQLMTGSLFAAAVFMAVLPFAPTVAVVAAALVAVAFVFTPFDISFLTLRQRRTDPSQFGRAFAVSVSLNVVGYPVGSALAGPIIDRSVDAALWVAVFFMAVAAVLPMLLSIFPSFSPPSVNPRPTSKRPCVQSFPMSCPAAMRRGAVWPASGEPIRVRIAPIALRTTPTMRR